MAINSNSNIDSLRVDLQINRHLSDVNKSFERLSSGKQINKASDNAAGLAIAAQLLATADTSTVAARNISDATSVASIADGALESVTSITQQLSDLAEQAANGTLSDAQRSSLNDQYQSLRSELDRISQTTSFNGQSLLNGGTSITLQAGTDGSANSQISLSLPGVSADSLGLAADISTQDNAKSAIDQAKSALDSVGSARGDIGSTVSRLDTAFQNLKTQEVNQRDAASRIQDTDVASESANLTSANISLQSSIAIKAQANLQPDLVLALLK